MFNNDGLNRNVMHNKGNFKSDLPDIAQTPHLLSHDIKNQMWFFALSLIGRTKTALDINSMRIKRHTPDPFDGNFGVSKLIIA